MGAGPLVHSSHLQQWDGVVQQLLEQEAGSDSVLLLGQWHLSKDD